MTEEPAAPALVPPPGPPLLGARELLLRAALGAALGVLVGLAFVLGLGPPDREQHIFVGIGLFLGGLTGLAGFVERMGAGRGAAAQVGLALGLFVVATGWGLAAIFQAQWTRIAWLAGPDAANAGVEQLLGYLSERPGSIVRLLTPFGAVVAAPALVRLRRGGWRAHLAAGALTLGVGAVFAERGDTRRLVLLLGAGLLATNAASAGLARALARRWWPPTPTDEASRPGAGGPA